MNTYYTTERNVQMLIYLMKKHGIKKVIASPGTTNITLVASLQQDPYFEMYSVADERSASYMACGLAAESNEPVVISCTGATASRNYIPGLTEAFYRKLPILAVTSAQHTGRIGQLCPQVIDRSVIPNDIAVKSVNILSISNSEDEWDCNVKLNDALLALTHRGGGPVHVNLVTTYNMNFSEKELPETRAIYRVSGNSNSPQIEAKRVAVFVGSHRRWSKELTEAVDEFCELYNGVVFCDHTSNYQGKYRIQYNLISGQLNMRTDLGHMDLLIDMGEMSGSYMSIEPEEVWRVNPDGEIRDTFKKLAYLFDMDELEFFEAYAKCRPVKKEMTYYEACKKTYNELLLKMPELPFSNAWTARQTAGKLPKNCSLHFAILNSLRSWNFFEISPQIDCYANTGGFGIDGCVSALIGAALADKNKLHFLVVGDLAFFYDLNAIANRNVDNNIRILLINNGCGTEFKNYSHYAAKFGESANDYIAASGHYGKQSRSLIKNYSENLDFEYLSASNKEEYLENMSRFINPERSDKPIVFEVFTLSEDESDALNLINHIIKDPLTINNRVKIIAKEFIGEQRVQKLKNMIKEK